MELQACMNEYRRQLEKGVIQVAYRGLMEYMMALRAHMANRYPSYFVSGSLYFGTMDMTYFACTPESLGRRKLKVAVVFVHDAFRFEAWLAAANKRVQADYWRQLQESHWDKYPIVPTTKGVDSIVEHVLAADPDFSDLDSLTGQIERETLRLIEDVESFLAEHAG